MQYCVYEWTNDCAVLSILYVDELGWAVISLVFTYVTLHYTVLYYGKIVFW